jgi:manganese/zinc/iron transport system permease protein
MLNALLQNWVWQVDGWIIVAGILCAATCALLGPFLVLRKMSMMGDAISHAVLPGLAVAFFVTESRASLPMFIGAAMVGILTAVFTEWVRGFGKVDEGASMGVVFTALFAAGLVMVVQAADKVDLDQGCVLYGAIELTPLDTVKVWGWDIPRVVLTLGGVLVLNTVCVVLFFKELKLSAFDPALATTLGINAKAMHYLLMSLVAVTTVAAFESVGNILVVAMLVVPAATAYMLTDRLATMIFLSLAIGAGAAVLGHLGATVVPAAFGYPSTMTSGMIAVMSGLLFAIAAIAGPRHGILARLGNRKVLVTESIPEGNA